MGFYRGFPTEYWEDMEAAKNAKPHNDKVKKLQDQMGSNRLMAVNSTFKWNPGPTILNNWMEGRNK